MPGNGLMYQLSPTLTDKGGLYVDGGKVLNVPETQVQGNLLVKGTVKSLGGNFQIKHPINPERARDYAMEYL